jgi:MFS family permease
MSETQSKIFYGWIIVIISTFALVVSNGLSTNGIPVFSEHIRNDFIASGAMQKETAQTTLANFGTLTFLFAGFIAPFAGYLIQKFNLKILMLIGCVILGSGLLIHSQANSVETVYLSRIMFGISLGFIGVLANTVLVSNWFQKKRGLALGIVLTGTSIGGIIIPIISLPLIKNYGWRTALIIVSLLVWFVLIPAIFFLVKVKPSEKNLFPDNEKSELNFETKTETGLTIWEAMKTPLFWIFALCAALIFYPLFVSTQQLILYIRTPKIGISPEYAAIIQSSISVLSICGKFAFGFISDRNSPSRVMFFCCGVMLLSTFVLLDFSVNTLFLFLIPFGLGYGGAFVLLQRLVADYFGTRDYAKILGAITVIETIGASIGGRITGAIADQDGGDYTRAFYGLIIATAIAFLLTIWLNFIVRNKYKKI